MFRYLTEALVLLKLGAAAVIVDKPASAYLARFNTLRIAAAASILLEDLRAKSQQLIGLRQYGLMQRLLLKHS
jgi:hypothetical protein